MKYSRFSIWGRFWYFWNRNKIFRAECGHETKLAGCIEAFGDQYPGKLSFKPDGTLPYCIECLGKMAIQCAWCGKGILPGDPVTLYSTNDPNFQLPEHARVYSEDPLQYVGCFRMTCAYGVDRKGFWAPPGKVDRVLSPLEVAMMVDGVVIVSDVTDPAEARNHTEIAINMFQKET